MNLDIFNEKYIHYLGRIDSQNNTKIFYSSNSGFEFTFFGSNVSLDICSNNDFVKLRIYIDNDQIGSIFTIGKNNKKIEIASNLVKKIHTIRAVKANSEEFGFLYLKNIICDGSFLELPKIKRLKFEFFGDSLTAGYGTNCLQGENTWENEDSTLTYARIVSDYFNADMVSTCYSGISIALPFWVEFPVIERFERYAYTIEKSWNFKNWIPDIVFISLGTNDSRKIDNENSIAFLNGVKLMINKLKHYYPNAKIVIYYGLIGTNEMIDKSYKTLISLFDKKDSIYYFNATNVNPTGAGGHPNAKEHIIGANELIQFLRNKFNL